MAVIKLQTDYKKYPRDVLEHIALRIKNHFLPPMADELADWLQKKPDVPDLTEAPQGWYFKFPSFTVCGEGQFLKTLYTIYAPGNPRQGSVDLVEWEKSRIKKLSSSQIVNLVADWLDHPSFGLR